MRIAYLILAHDNAVHLARLVRTLDSPNAVFFIHIDRKFNIEDFRALLAGPNVKFVDDRIAVYWGEFSGVEATITLMKAALKCSFSPDYLCLLSGSHYPLKPPRYIEEFFSRNHGRQFISLVRLPCEAAGKPSRRIEGYVVRTRIDLPLVHRAVSRLNRLLDERLRLKRDFSKVLGDMTPYAGSGWWALTAEACEHILEFVEGRPDIVKFFTNVPCPDESFFHTILANSRFMGQVGRSLTLTKWDGRSHPRLIEIGDIAPFADGGPIIDGGVYGEGEVLFARKFTDRSEDVVRFIDIHLLRTDA